MTTPQNYWLIKSEPDEYSIDDLARDGTSPWTGVRNYQARNFMRDSMNVGDQVLYYHSTCTPPGIVGLATVGSEPYPDPTQFDPKDENFDPTSPADNPRWILVDIHFKEKFKRQLTLDEIKTDPKLEGIRVAQRGNRLSVLPVTREHFQHILGLLEL